MFEWMNKHKKDIMKYTLFLVIPGFVLLYGYGECAAPQRYQWVAKVNGQEIPEYEYRMVMDNLRARYRQNPQMEEPSSEQLRSETLDTVIVATLLQQKADKWGIETTNQEVAETIRQIPNFQDETNTFSYQQYRMLLNQVGYTEQMFEEEQRETITRSKVQAVINSSFFRPETDVKRIEGMQDELVEVEFLAFKPSSYVDEVEINDQGVNSYFQNNKEDYRIPEQRKVAYARFDPEEYIDQVNVNEREVERYFQRNIQQYETPKKITMQYINYDAQSFADMVEVSEAQTEAYYNENKAQFTKPEQVKVKYVQIPFEEYAEEQVVSNQAVESYYQQNIAQFEHEEQAKVRHILKRVSPTATEEEKEAVRQELLDIRQEIVDGKPFEEAAQEYSDDPGSKEDGGLYDFFGRGRMVQPFEEASFNLPIGQISDPVETQYGFHLIRVEDRREAGTEPLESVEDEIREQLQREKAITAVRELAASIDSIEAVTDEYEIHTTDYFGQGDEVQGIPQADTFTFIPRAMAKTGGVKMAGTVRSQNLYLIETIDRQPPRPMTLEEARSEIVDEIQANRAQQLANQMAQADMEQIRSATVELQTIAENRGLEVQTTEPFSSQDQFVPGFGPRNATLNRTAFQLEEGEVEGPIMTNSGTYIIRVAAVEEPRLPEFSEVEQEVTQEFIREQAASLARANANSFSVTVFSSQDSLLNVAASENVESGSTGLFEQNAPVPPLGRVPAINEAAFELEEEQNVSDAIEVRQQQQFMMQQQQQQMPIDAYYVVQLLEIKDDYLPDLEEVRAQVEEDYKLQLAEPIAKEHAQQTLEMIKETIANSEPLSATRAVDLESFEFDQTTADGNNQVNKGATYYGPYEINGMGQVPTVGRAYQFVKTAMALEPGQVSNVVVNHQVQYTEEGEREEGQMTGAYIIQVLDKPEPPEETPQQTQMAQFMDQAIQRMALAAWVSEASAAANIEYNEDYFVFDEPDDEATLSENVQTQEEAS